MKFIPGSPDIPDELINAVLKGGAVFLCGAGVSKYAVNLPLFCKLTRDIYEELNEKPSNEPAEEHAIERLEYDRALRSLEKRTRLPRAPSCVREATIKLITPKVDSDVSNHLNLLKLSRDSDGRVRILTTNYDPLFELAALQEDVAIPNPAGKAIPRPGTTDDHGILHLHGRIPYENELLKYTGSDLILTSADFGDAYLRDGWAAQYIEDRMRINTLVLVGYQAEDAAMRLLLETLDADRDRFSDLKKVYAIEKKKPKSASIWKAKGVIPIEFENYEQIYATLAEWAVYVSNPTEYREKKLRGIFCGD